MSDEQRTAADHDRAAILDLASRLQTYGEPPRICGDAASVLISMIHEIEELRRDVIAFCAPWAASYGRDHGLPDGHLHPTHYDILARCGARMDSFTRSELA
jgi:hypothetical protein